MWECSVVPWMEFYGHEKGNTLSLMTDHGVREMAMGQASRVSDAGET